MAHGVEIRVPYVDRVVLELLGPGGCLEAAAPQIPISLRCWRTCRPACGGRRKTGFITPALQWATGETDPGRRGLEHWANLVARIMRRKPTRRIPEWAPRARGVFDLEGGGSDHLQEAS